MWFTKGSTIIQDIHYVDNLEQSDVFLSTLNDIKNKYGDKYEHLILIGTNDLYVKLIISHRDLLKDDFLFNYIDDQDRKSTRLNSSHVAISYAVFCLK